MMDTSPRKNNLEEVRDTDSSHWDRYLDGQLICHLDDKLNECIMSTIRQKSRVKYKCMDTQSNYLAFGTSGGAIYLYILESISHSSCSLAALIPCDQGSIEVIKFLPHDPQTNELLIVIGTSRGSIVLFRLNRVAGELNNIISSEIYKAESFTNNIAIKFIEFDQDLFAPISAFSKLYICDQANRIYLLEGSTICASNKSKLRLFHTNRLPSLIFSVRDSKINQVSVHRSQLLISTDETTRWFNEESNQVQIIGRKKRREGFYGACFFNPQFKPYSNINQPANTNGDLRNNNRSLGSYASSLNDPYENLLVFVSRPMFRLWQVNNQSEVMFTHQFEPLIKFSPPKQIVELHNEPLIDFIEQDDPNEIILKSFSARKTHENNEVIISDNTSKNTKKDGKNMISCDHFQKLISIYTSTMGNLLLSYTQHEIYIIDPIGARLIAWHSQAETIFQVSNIENELFILSQVSHELSNLHRDHSKVTNNSNSNPNSRLELRRLVLMSSIQLVLELHRLNRFLSLVTFVQLFTRYFKQQMALPLTGASLITAEGGLLRNVLLNAWDMSESRIGRSEIYDFNEFKKIIDEIIGESRKIKQSVDNLTDSNFFLSMNQENIDRLCSEPYASLVSLQVSIAALHSDHVVHFDQDPMNRHRSVTNLHQNIRNINQQKCKSIAHMSAEPTSGNLIETEMVTNEENANDDDDATERNELQTRIASRGRKRMNDLSDKLVIVERQKPKKSVVDKNRRQQVTTDGERIVITSEVDEQRNNDYGDDNNNRRRLLVNKTFPSSGSNSSVSRISTSSSCSNGSSNDIKVEKSVHDSALRHPHNNRDSTLIDVGSLRYKQTEADREKRNKLMRCTSCQWPRPHSHLRHMNSGQQIQKRWIEDSLMGDIERNMDEIEKRAFENGLWHLFLRCLLKKNKLDEIVLCCAMLDDIRLLPTVGAITSSSDSDDAEGYKLFVTEEDLGKIIDSLFVLLRKKLENENQYNDNLMVDNVCDEFNEEKLDEAFQSLNSTATNGGGRKKSHKNRIACLRCDQPLDSLESIIEDLNDLELTHSFPMEVEGEADEQTGEHFGFNLINLVENFMMKHLNIKQVLAHLSKHTDVLNKSKIPIMFYLKSIASATLSAKQSPLSRVRLNKLLISS